MAIKGLKEALAKKRAQQHPENRDPDSEVRVANTPPVRPGGSKPQKKAAGRGR